MGRCSIEVYTWRIHLPGNVGFSHKLKITSLCVMIWIWAIPMGSCAQHLILSWWPYFGGLVKRSRSLRRVIEGNILSMAPYYIHLVHHETNLLLMFPWCSALEGELRNHEPDLLKTWIKINPSSLRLFLPGVWSQQYKSSQHKYPQDGSAGQCAHHQSWHLSLPPRTYVIKGEKQPVVSWPLRINYDTLIFLNQLT